MTMNAPLDIPHAVVEAVLDALNPTAYVDERYDTERDMAVGVARAAILAWHTYHRQLLQEQLFRYFPQETGV